MDWKTIDARVEELSMLKHPFYKAWSAGMLTKDDLRYYAKQYYALENEFPRLLSRIHSSCEDAAVRREILENLVDEERGPENHRELWLRFAEGLGVAREEVLAAEPSEATRDAVRALRELAADPEPAVGLCALYAYESQLPRVSEAKLDGLKKLYGIDDERTTRFFEVHREADVWHSEAEKRIVSGSGLPLEKARAAAESAASALLRFLDGVDAETRLKRGAACAC